MNGPVELPGEVRVREVGPRDGFQNEPEIIPTDVKVALVEALGRTGLRRLEVTSFVRPDVIPQLLDAVAKVEKREREIIEYCKSPGFTVDGLKVLMR